MHFNLFIFDTGHHEASWRLQEKGAGEVGGDPLANTDVGYYEALARTAEAAKFDSVFLADAPALWSDPGRRPSGRLEPIMLLTALARATQRIGLISTASTSYNDPYNLARRFASLDHISGGRWSCSRRTWCRSCSGAACSAPSTRARRCGSTTGWAARPASTPTRLGRRARPAGSR
ncbi:MAG TPA: LLM class flavin-dependent oxidoreductase [Streptosporangiaceae bacterium]|jgi:hypothetical protein|nr:LLM class flavin-dependent oxidoreductase [Streptosporangiaceae bacterium]